MKPILNVDPVVNSTFVRFYTAGSTHSYANHKHFKLRKLAWDTWQLGKDQALLECMTLGYSLCVAKPIIDEVHDRMDREYEEWCAAHCTDQNEDTYPI